MSQEDKKSLVLSRRNLVRAATAGAAFTVPLMASFSKDGLAINAASAQGNRQEGGQEGARQEGEVEPNVRAAHRTRHRVRAMAGLAEVGRSARIVEPVVG
jgi:hypothetical protein